MVRYRAAAPDTMRLEPLDTMTAIYHRASGRTHLVASPVPEILTALEQGDATVQQLLDRLAAQYDLADGEAGALTARLAELEEAGLVERA
ncbi:PqqD family protein of HPr-rel-A system [Stakelama sediminis]|uniref:PqqD family protein of HPr-rel-A system n=1 Tax=Stakelama sediminis TaxID=463200 RepID=A0A840Z0Y3_9SPHN|nr:PqqD family protein of HPr-rel-A system [Stakelama sediminis]